MEKARSRLHHFTPESSEAVPPTKTAEHQTKASSAKATGLLAHYVRHLPTLALAIPFWLGCFYLFTRISPSQVQNIGLTNAYLPLIILVGLATFFTTSFMVLNSRRGLWVALLVMLYLFLKLQQVIISVEVVLVPLIFFGILELGLSIYGWFSRRQ